MYAVASAWLVVAVLGAVVGVHKLRQRDETNADDVTPGGDDES